MRRNMCVWIPVTLMALASLAPGPASAQSKPSTTMTAASPSGKTASEQIIAAERSGWESIKKKDLSIFDDITTDDFVYLGPTGFVRGKAATMDEVRKQVITGYTMNDPKVMMLSPTIGLVTYSADVQGTYDGQPQAVKQYWSALYVKRKGKWMAVFSQESDAPEQSTK